MVDIKLGEEHTKYEEARIIGSRALQIAMGAPLMIKFTKKQLEEMKFNPIEIAKKEYAANKLPITVRRNLPHEEKSY